MSLARPPFLPDQAFESRHPDSNFLGNFLRREAVGGVIALVAAVIAVIWANSFLGDSYESFKHYELGPLDMETWAADGALTVFFFVAGLELKREFVVGSLRRVSDAAVPVVAAVAGVAVPALIYTIVNLVGDGDLGGWAIPSATDIAFALAVLAVVGSQLPQSLRTFLLTLAVVDDLIVITIIALFYSSSLALLPLALSVLGLVVWAALMHLRVSSPLLYVPLAVAIWWGVHESGIHATVAGVLLGLLTRVRPDENEAKSPAEHLEHVISPISSSIAVPFFALLSAGVVLSGGGDLVRDPVVLGVVLGLVIGKPLGVFGGAWVLTRFTGADLNGELSYRDIVGAAVLAGVGFTVSLLVSDLSFTGETQAAAKVGVLVASVASALIGALILGRRSKHHAAAAEERVQNERSSQV